MTAVARLTEWIEAHVPADALEREHCDRMRALVERGAPSCRRDHFDPGHFTASAFVLSPDATSLLLIFHRKLGLWLQPGGHVEADDADLVASARREVLEEVGLDGLELAHDGIFDVDVHRIPARPDEPEHEHFDARFLFRARALELRVGDEVAGARWVPLGKIGRVHGDESVLRAVRKLGERGSAA